jgi:hypothetical protein
MWYRKTASASLKKLQNGVWVVTDFGGQVPRNAIVCQLEVTYGEACALLELDLISRERKYINP